MLSAIARSRRFWLATVSTLVPLSYPLAQTREGTSLPSVTVDAPQRARPGFVPAPRRSAVAPRSAPARLTRRAPEARRTIAATPAALIDPAPALPAGSFINPGLPVEYTTAGAVQGYRALSAVSATKTDTAIERIPQSIQVVPRSLIDDQRNLSVTEAVQNVSNVQAPNTYGIGNSDLQPVKIRGFGAEQWLDGIAVTNDAGNRDALADVERIEILKGPNAILYGGGPGSPVGGAINIVSKLPTDKASGEFGMTFGSHTYLRPSFDVNQPLNADKTVLFRMTGEYTSADSFINVLQSKRYSFNPTLTLTNKTDTTLTIQARVSRWEQQAYPGLPATGTVAGDFRIARRAFLGPETIDPSFSEVRGITATLDHQFNPVFSANVKARVSQTEFVQKSQILINGDFSGATPLLPPSFWGLGNTRLAQKQQEFTINPNLKAKFDLGISKNTLLIGADYTRITDKGYMYTDILPGLVDLSNPSFPTPYTDPLPTSPGFIPFFDFSNVYTTKGAYAQLQSTLYDRVHLMGGLRAANVNIDYFEKTLLSSFRTDTTKILPKAGLVVDLMPGFAVYASYGEGMRGVPFSTAALQPKPEQSAQREAGIKFNIGNQFSGTAAFFDIERTNIPVTLGLGIAAQSKQRSRGFETDLIWQPTTSWQLLANYAYTDVRFSDTLQGVPQGNRVAGVPQHSGRLWVNYKPDLPALKGWSAGAGVYMASDQFVDSANNFKTSGYYTIDARIAYTTDRYTASLNVKNLTNTQYFVPYAWLGGQVAPGEGRAIYGALTYKY